jgi:hypothetical protein
MSNEDHPHIKHERADRGMSEHQQTGADAR